MYKNNIEAKISWGGGGKERIKYIDITKIITVLFIIIDHIQYYIPVNNAFMVLRVIWLAFFLQVLFITTGITSNYPTIGSIKDIGRFVDKKFRTLMVPYIVWCFFLNMSGKHDLSFFKNIILGRMEDLDSVGVNSVLWFFPVIFMSHIVTVLLYNTFHFCTKVHRYVYYSISMIFLFIVDRVINVYWGDYLFFGLRSACLGAAFIFAGMLVKEILNRIYINFSVIKKLVLFAALLAAGIPLAYLNMPVVSENGNIYYPYSVWVARGITGKNGILFFITSVCLSVGIMVFSMCLEKISILAYCGRRSLLYMTGHIYTHSIVAVYIFPIIQRYLGERTNICMLLFLMASLFFITFMVPFIDKYMPFLYKSIK